MADTMVIAKENCQNRRSSLLDGAAISCTLSVKSKIYHKNLCFSYMAVLADLWKTTMTDLPLLMKLSLEMTTILQNPFDKLTEIIN